MVSPGVAYAGSVPGLRLSVLVAVTLMACGAMGAGGFGVTFGAVGVGVCAVAGVRLTFTTCAIEAYIAPAYRLERQTERGEGLYLPTEEDMIVRYLEHLVFLTLRRGSFYVTLVVGALLHQFNRRETRLFYDILTQNDPARMKDTGYIGKQRLEMLEIISKRFGQMIRTAKSRADEK